MSDVNPYASPQQFEPVTGVSAESPFAGGAPPAPKYRGLWRDGRLLVMHKRARLPDVCVKSNRPADVRLRRKLAWHHPAIYLLIFVALLIYIIVALAMTKKATIFIGLSKEWAARRRRWIVVAWGLVLPSVAMFVGAIPLFDTIPDLAAWLMLLSLPLFLAGLIVAAVGPRMVVPVRITDDHVWLKGVHPDFLAELPPLPGLY